MSDRKKVIDTINGISFLLERHQHNSEELIRLLGAKEYKQISDLYNKAIAKLKKEKYALPIGHRYTGTFYVKKPYTMPTAYDEITGSVFMREDLVSWKVEDVEKYNFSYFRAVYREPNDDAGSEITREDGEPVFITEQEELAETVF